MRLCASTSMATASLFSLFLAAPLGAQTVTFRPYIEPGDNGPFGAKDQMVVTWQTDESHPLPSAYTVQFGKSPTRLESATVDARVVDNYLSADPQFSALVLPFRYGAHSNYTAVLRNLQYDRTYYGVNLGDTAIDLSMETRGPEHIREILDALTAAEYRHERIE